jgi:hypothetical protein
MIRLQPLKASTKRNHDSPITTSDFSTVSVIFGLQVASEASVRPSMADMQRLPRQVRFVPILLQKSVEGCREQ